MAAEPAADDHDSRPPPADGPAVAGEGDASASAAADALMSAASEQLTLVYQGDVFVFDPVPPQKVAPFAPSRIPSPPSGSPRWSRDAALTCYGWSQFLLPLDDLRWQRIVPRVQAVLLVLGGYEVPPGLVNMAVPTANDEKSTTVAARRVASLMRFREKRKERCFDKRIRYSVRKEGTLRSPLNAPKMTLQHPANPSKMGDTDGKSLIVLPVDHNQAAVKTDSGMMPEQEQKLDICPPTEKDIKSVS
nr:unnamed protein product [Digitaria exilis]